MIEAKCPKCGAKGDERCVTETGNKAKRWHSERFDAENEARAEERRLRDKARAKESGAITITPQVWALRSAHDKDNTQGVGGIYFDGERATATNGSILVSVPCEGPKMEGLLVLCRLPEKIREPVTVPCTPGVHAVLDDAGQLRVVEVVKSSIPFPDWRGAIPAKERPKQAFTVKHLRAILDAAVSEGAKYVHLGIEPGGLGPVVVEDGRGNNGVIAIIAPCREEK